VCSFGTQTRVLVVECLSGLPSSPKWLAVCTFGTHTCLSGWMSKWFVVCSFGTQSQGWNV